MVENKRTYKVAKDKWHLMWQNGKFDFKCHGRNCRGQRNGYFFQDAIKKFTVAATALLPEWISWQLFVCFVLFCLGVWFCFCFAVFSFKEGLKNGCSTGKVEGENGGAWETNKKVEMVQQKDSLELVMQLEENIVVEMEALGVQGAPEKGA